MNIKYKNFIFNGLTYGVIFFLLSFICYYAFNFPLKKAALYSVPIGLFALIINGLIQSRFTKSSKTLKAIIISLEDFETLKIEAPANHTIDDHLISGKLFLTDKRLVFISHQQEEYYWLLTNLHSFKCYGSIFNAGGEFILTDNSKNKLVFEVDEIKIWKKAMTNVLQ